MVNLGRSKGCLTCRRRKIKCDETTPSCQRCHKSGLQCAGYESRFQIIEGASASSDGQGQVTAPVKGFILCNDPVQQTTALTRPLDLSAFSEVISRSFLVEKLCKPTAHGGLFVLNLEGNSTELGRLSFDAISMRLFGQYHRQDEICQRSAAMYGEALGELGKTVRQGDAIPAIQAILAVLALGLYEGVSETSLPNIFIHWDGLAALVENCGPAFFQSDLGIAVFEFVREVLSPVAIAHHKRSFLERKEWLELPWTGRPKGLKANFYDQVLKIAGIWEDLGHLQLSKTRGMDVSTLKSQATRLRASLSHCHREVSGLVEGWYESKSTSFRQIDFDEYQGSDRLQLRYPFHLFDPPIHFANFDGAFFYALFNMTECELLMLDSELSDLESELVIGETPPSDISQNTRLHYARNICRAVPYAINSPVHGWAGAVVFQWYLHRIFPFFDRESEEATWIHGVIKTCASSLGLKGAQDYLNGYWERVYQTSDRPRISFRES